ncbi:hypothetical protein FACS1894179_03640 [Bacteroidia bacterium]|nr:hypothetical protein FACS1894179_03640 [Bacteroidia bacterium]
MGWLFPILVTKLALSIDIVIISEFENECGVCYFLVKKLRVDEIRGTSCWLMTDD